MIKSILLTGAFAILATAASAVVEVTVASDNTGDFLTINDAVSFLGPLDQEEAIITILDEGPIFESTWVLLNETTIGTRPLTIRGAEGVRPIVICNYTGDGAIYVRKGGGPLVIEDLVLIPHLENQAQSAMRIHNYTVPDGGVDETSITLRNICITSNDGFNQPVGSLDGMTSPVISPTAVSFRDEGFFFPSSSTTNLRQIAMYDCVVTGLNGDQGVDGIRVQGDGTTGSKLMIGPGCVVSYNNTLNPTQSIGNGNAAVQPGGILGGKILTIEGTQEKPVLLINNNFSGISYSGEDGPGQGTTLVKWTIIANNSLCGIRNNALNKQDTLYENVTIVNSGLYAVGNEVGYSSDFSFVDTIIAGSGDPSDSDNLISSIPDGTATITNSAVVLSGPYTLNNTSYDQDGLEDPTPSNVTKINVISADPVFASLDPASPDFAVVTNAAYGTAGSGGQPLVGGGTFAPASVSDWQLF